MMTYKYFPHTDTDIKQMLDIIGVNSLEELYAEIPKELTLKDELNIEHSHSELELRKKIEKILSKDKTLKCFAGAGVYDHYLPSVVSHIVSRSEFSTSYTPYQAEISQGTLQYIFEYQSIMSELTGMDISNASMYDGSTATAEAMLMCISAAKKRNTILVSDTLLPQVKEVITTYAKYHGINIEFIPEQNGATDSNFLQNRLTANDVAGVIVQQPNRFGIIEDYTGYSEVCHKSNALFVINSHASTLGILKSPGEWNADIACGEAQSLGIPMSYGGPYIGYLCTTHKLVRKMPGRLVGATTDSDGNRCFVLTLQAREQHIRREKATSNICTAQGVMCLYIASYLSLLGKKGLHEVNQLSYSNAHYLYEQLLATHYFKPVFDLPFLNEFVVEYTADIDQLIHQAIELKGIFPGIKIEYHDKNLLLIAVTEKQTKEDLDEYIAMINQIA